MHVIATAGHVDHGKSTLVRSLTGMEPDRWSEERRRGMTIDLGYAWTTLADGSTVAFVDVPGHERFIGNMLAGLGPVGAVMFVVAADEGWKEQSAEHLLAIDALGLRSGLLVVTRSDLADPAPAVATARARLAESSLGDLPFVCVSGRTGTGMPELRAALTGLVATLPVPPPTGRVRLWIDRSFTIRGSGTVVTGTHTSGTLTGGDELELLGRHERRPIRIRGLQVLGEAADRVQPVARVAVNLRQVAAQQVRRGDVLLTPGGWRLSTVLEGRITEGIDLPGEVTLHLGTAALPAKVRPLGPGAVRLLLRHPLPAQPGDRVLLQDQTTRRILAGVLVVDVEPPELRRRGSAALRATELLEGEVTRGRATLARRGAILAQEMEQRGETVAPSEAVALGRWLVSPDQLERWVAVLRSACAEQRRSDSLRPGLVAAAAVRVLGLPDPALLPPVVDAADLVLQAGMVQAQGVVPDLGAAEPGLRRLEDQLRAAPFDAPDRPRLTELGLGPRELATAAALGRIIRLDPEIVLLPGAPALAMRALAALPEPFTTSQARGAWSTTRRVAIPLLEFLDERGWTRRINAAGERQVVREGRRSG